jgi:hypothetical protein
MKKLAKYAPMDMKKSPENVFVISIPMLTLLKELLATLIVLVNNTEITLSEPANLV